MEPKFLTRFDNYTGIFIKEYFGEITIKDLICSWEDIIQKSLIPPNTKRFLISYKEATISFSTKHITEIANLYKEHDAIFGGAKIAMVMDTPEKVVFPNLMLTQDINFMLNMFNSMGAAIDWLIS